MRSIFLSIPPHYLFRLNFVKTQELPVITATYLNIVENTAYIQVHRSNKRVVERLGHIVHIIVSKFLMSVMNSAINAEHFQTCYSNNK